MVEEDVLHTAAVTLGVVLGRCPRLVAGRATELLHLRKGSNKQNQILFLVNAICYFDVWVLVGVGGCGCMCVYGWV